MQPVHTEQVARAELVTVHVTFVTLRVPRQLKRNSHGAGPCALCFVQRVTRARHATISRSVAR